MKNNKLQTLKYKRYNKIEGYYLDEIEKVLSKKEYKIFLKWIRGQTIMKNGKRKFIYRWDFEKWVWLTNSQPYSIY